MDRRKARSKVRLEEKSMTLLKGNELNSANAKKLDLVLRRKSGESKFSEMLIGDKERLEKHKEALFNLLSDDLLPLILWNQ